MTPVPVPRGSEELHEVFGSLDIYVFDQLLRGRIRPDVRVLDAGCGTGRNSEYLMRCGAEVHGVDTDPQAIERIRQVAAKCAPDLPATNFRVGPITGLPYEDGSFGVVICNTVLHFAEDEAAFEGMLAEMWRVLAPGGVFFSRLASTIGMESRVVPLHGRWFRMLDGTDRFLVDEAYLMRVTADLGAALLDPIKTTVVQDLRSMTTWVMRKPPTD